MTARLAEDSASERRQARSGYDLNTAKASTGGSRTAVVWESPAHLENVFGYRHCKMPQRMEMNRMEGYCSCSPCRNGCHRLKYLGVGGAGAEGNSTLKISSLTSLTDPPFHRPCDSPPRARRTEGSCLLATQNSSGERQSICCITGIPQDNPIVRESVDDVWVQQLHTTTGRGRYRSDTQRDQMPTGEMKRPQPS